MEQFAAQYFASCQGPVLEEARRIIQRWTSGDERTYGLMVEYLERRAKGLRPGLCIAVCRALGGSMDEVLPSAAVVELFHNAFLIHDDIEDGAFERRGGPALHHACGLPTALNVGDGLLALSLRPLLENTERLGLARTLQILDIVVEMVTATFEGQAMELRWIAEGAWQLDDSDYEEMALKKTCWYSFVAPARVGAVVARADPALIATLVGFMERLGLAFQIQDDLLNLEKERSQYGKEHEGDLWEGKRTLMLLHGLRSASDDERRQALEILARPRPLPDARQPRLRALLAQLRRDGSVDSAAHDAILAHMDEDTASVRHKSADDVAVLRTLIDKYDGVTHARGVATRHAQAALDAWNGLAPQLPESVHTRFLSGLTEFVVRREC